MLQSPLKNSPWLKMVKDYILLGVCIALIYWILAPEKERFIYPVTLASLTGVWTTTHPQYQDRYLQFSEKSIVFGRGAAPAGFYAIESFHTEPAKDGTLVTVTYADQESTVYQLNVTYVAQNGGMLWMKNQRQVIWRRTSTVPVY